VNRSPVLAEENGSVVRRRPRASPAPATPGGSLSSEHLPSPNGLSPEEQENIAETDLVFSVSIPLPVSTTFTHTLDPVTVSHRIRWCIFLLNPDGHTSELRCSLPLHILHPCLLDEAIASTRTTRRLLLGDSEEEQAEDADNVLPSYNAHLRDRVANMFLSDVVTLRVSNPWVLQNRSPVIGGHETPATQPSASPVEAQHFSHLPNVPSPEESSPLHWVNYELLLSLSENRPDALPGPDTSNLQSSTDSGSSSRNSRQNSRPVSLFMSNTRPNSTMPSHANSRASSPERGERAATSETYVHGESQASRALPSVFKAGLKPLSTIAPPWLPTRSASLPFVPTLTHPVTPLTPEAASSAQSHALARMVRPPSVSDAELLHRAFTAVPDYEVASRGFLGGGVTPLSSMQGLPSYEEASRQPNRVSV
jgi:arrestin-related trafficking adapter 4/5/7